MQWHWSILAALLGLLPKYLVLGDGVVVEVAKLHGVYYYGEMKHDLDQHVWAVVVEVVELTRLTL